jgi:DNA-binding MarR family transcriptional regulator
MGERSQLQRELKQQRAFKSPSAEATIGIVRTADLLKRAWAEALAPHGITPQQYNVLRILRGADPDPLPTLEIGERLIEQTPGVTRLLDRLEAKGLVRRQRCGEDRRLMHCWISPAGMDLLANLDPLADRMDKQLLAQLDTDEVRELIRLLDLIRSRQE